MTAHRQVGTVEILRTRIYPLDSQTDDNPLSTTVVVDPGVYPLFRYFDATYWMMTGRINGRGIDKIGDGLFTMNCSDAPSGPEVRFPSRRFGPDEWAELLAEPTCTEGAPEQRLRINVYAPARAELDATVDLTEPGEKHYADEGGLRKVHPGPVAQCDVCAVVHVSAGE
jgi:hypothetical protein